MDLHVGLGYGYDGLPDHFYPPLMDIAQFDPTYNNFDGSGFVYDVPTDGLPATFELPVRTISDLAPLNTPEIQPCDRNRDQNKIARRKKSKGYDREQWENIRDIFTRIYKEPGVTLEIAMDIMADQYDFHATKPMYKKRITEWDILKNLRAEEKDRLAQEAEILLSTEQFLPQKDSNGCKIYWDRVRRHDRSWKKRQGVWKQIASRQRHVLSRDRQLRVSEPHKNITPSLLPPSDLHHIENTFYWLRALFDHISPVDWHNYDLAAECRPYWLQNYQKGVSDLLKARQSLATERFIEAGEMFDGSSVLQNPISLLLNLVQVRSLFSRTSMFGHYPLIARFMMKTISKALGEVSPLTKLAMLLLPYNPEDYSELAVSVLRRIFGLLPDQSSFMLEPVYRMDHSAPVWMVVFGDKHRTSTDGVCGTLLFSTSSKCVISPRSVEHDREVFN